MSSDISRGPDGRSEPLTGIVAQQGRVIVDRDINTLQTIINNRSEAEARDIIGLAGTPDDGFAISLPSVGSPPSGSPPPFWTPPAPLTLGPEGAGDFLIKPGTMYVGGQRVVFSPRQAGRQITYAYYDQPDWASPPTAAASKVAEAVYLKVVEHELSAVEDPNLLDVALGGVDTTQRLRQVRRVVRQSVNTTDCATAWTSLTMEWLKGGLSFDPYTMRLTPTATLLAGFDQSKAPPDPCDPVAVGGYLGADNQLIRVQISADSGSPSSSGSPPSKSISSSPPPTLQFLWGYDNASFLYRVARNGIAANGTMLQIERDPPDAFHTPQAGQAIEILRTAAIIASEPDETDPTGLSTIVRCVAEETGFVTTLTRGYGPATIGSATSFLVLADPLPSAYLNDADPLFVRIWQGQQGFTSGQAVDLVDPVTNTTNGLVVTISTPTGEAPAPGAYWLIAVRPSTPQLIYPERLLSEAQPPDGPRQWVCPLAVIDWGKETVHDCRQFFDNLVTLTKRPAGCCTVNITPSDLGNDTLQAAIDRAVTLAEQVTVCLGPGVFELPGSLRLSAAHDNLRLSSCAGGATLQAAAGADPGSFTDGLLVVANASGVALRGLQMTLPTGALPSSLLTELQKLGQKASGGQPRNASNTAAMIGVRAVGAGRLTIEECAFEFPQPAGAPDIVGAGVFLQGDCSGLTVRGCSFVSAVPPTFTANAATAAGAAPMTATGAATSTQPVATSTAPSAAIAPAVTQPSAAVVVPGTPPASGVAATGTALASGVPATTLDTSLFDLDAVSRLKAIAALSSIGVITTQAPPPPLVATIGILAVTSAPGIPNPTTDALLVCRLGATFRGNVFIDLTMAAFLFKIDGKTLRLQDNDATGCVFGLWLSVSNARAPTDPIEYNALTAALSFSESLLAMTIGEWYPLPAGASGTPFDVISPTSLTMTNNGFEVIPSAGQGSAAVFISANRPIVQGTTVSIVLSGNRLRSQSFTPAPPAPSSIPPVPTVLMVMPDDERCAITGNLILNENFSGAGISGGSLVILPNTSSPFGGVVSTISMLAVAGNVLVGTSNLNVLTRPAAFSGGNWTPYNWVQIP